MSPSLCESNSGECSRLVLARRHIRKYGDEKNRTGVPPELVEAEEGMSNEFIIPTFH